MESTKSSHLLGQITQMRMNPLHSKSFAMVMASGQRLRRYWVGSSMVSTVASSCHQQKSPTYYVKFAAQPDGVFSKSGNYNNFKAV